MRWMAVELELGRVIWLGATVDLAGDKTAAAGPALPRRIRGSGPVGEGTRSAQEGAGPARAPGAQP